MISEEHRKKLMTCLALAAMDSKMCSEKYEEATGKKLSPEEVLENIHKVKDYLNGKGDLK